MITTVHDVYDYLECRGFCRHRVEVHTQSSPPAVIILMKYFWFSKKKLENDIWIQSVPGLWVKVIRWSFWKWCKYIFFWDDRVLGHHRPVVCREMDAPLVPGHQLTEFGTIGLTMNESYQNLMKMIELQILKGLGITPPNLTQRWEERWRKK